MEVQVAKVQEENRAFQVLQVQLEHQVHKDSQDLQDKLVAQVNLDHLDLLDHRDPLDHKAVLDHLVLMDREDNLVLLDHREMLGQ